MSCRKRRPLHSSNGDVGYSAIDLGDYASVRAAGADIQSNDNMGKYARCTSSPRKQGLGSHHIGSHHRNHFESRSSNWKLGVGPGPRLATDTRTWHHHHHNGGWFGQWKKILGIDTFVETAFHGYEGRKNRSRQQRNPYSVGCIQNCKDFWCDPAPLFGKRENGEAVLGGEPVNYTMMYETPMPYRRTRGGGMVRCMKALLAMTLYDMA